jgi:isoamylase
VPHDDYAQEWTVELDTTSPTGAAERVVKGSQEVAIPARSVLILRKTL